MFTVSKFVSRLLIKEDVMNSMALLGRMVAFGVVLLGVTSVQAGDIYTVNAYMSANSSREKEVILDAGTYVAYVNVDQGDHTKVELEAELTRGNVRSYCIPPRTCPSGILEVEFTIDEDDTKYAVRVRNTSSQRIEIYLKLKEKD